MRYFFCFCWSDWGLYLFAGDVLWGGGLGYVVRICFRKDATLSRAICWAHFPACRKKKEKNCCGRHFRCLGKSLMDGLWALTASPDDLRRFIVVQNEEQLNGERANHCFCAAFLGYGYRRLAVVQSFFPVVRSCFFIGRNPVNFGILCFPVCGVVLAMWVFPLPKTILCGTACVI